MEEFITAIVKDAPLLGILMYILYMVNTTGKDVLETLQRIETKLDQTREKSAMSEAAQAKSANPWREDTR
jgi:hypothetical protein